MQKPKNLTITPLLIPKDSKVSATVLKLYCEISGWFEKDFKEVETKYVENLRELKEIRDKLKDFVRQLPDVTFRASDVDDMCFGHPPTTGPSGSYLDVLHTFHAFWIRKNMDNSIKEWNTRLFTMKFRKADPMPRKDSDPLESLEKDGAQRDLTRVCKAFQEISRTIHAAYTPVLQRKHMSSRALKRILDDRDAANFLKEKLRVSTMKLNGLLAAPHTQVMRYAMKFETLKKKVLKFEKATSSGDTRSMKMDNILKKLKSETCRINEEKVWAPKDLAEAVFHVDPFGGTVTFRDRNAQIRLRNYIFVVNIRGKTYDLYLVNGSILFGAHDAVGRSSLKWFAYARLEGLRVQKIPPGSRKSQEFVLTATRAGPAGSLWKKNGMENEKEIRLKVVEQDNDATSLDEEIEKLREVKWEPYHGIWKRVVGSMTMDVHARRRCGYVVSFFSFIYVLGTVLRYVVFEESDQDAALASIPKGLVGHMSFVAHKLLTVGGYLLPGLVGLLLRLSHHDWNTMWSDVTKQEIASDFASWVCLYVLSYYVVAPVSNVLFPLLTWGAINMSVSNMCMMTCIAWGHASLVMDLKWCFDVKNVSFTRLAFASSCFAFLVVLYGWMAYVTSRHYASASEVCASLILSWGIIAVYVGIFDRLQKARSAIKRLGSRRHSIDRSSVALQDIYTAVLWLMTAAIFVVAFFVVVKRVWDPDFRLGSRFIFFLPQKLNFICLFFGAAILYHQHGYLLASLYAPLWAACGFACYSWFAYWIRRFGGDKLALKAVVKLAKTTNETRVQETLSEWNRSDKFAFMTFCALAVCVVQARDIPKYFFIVHRNRNSAVHLVRGTILHLAYFCTYLQLLAQIYRAVLESWQTSSADPGDESAPSTDRQTVVHCIVVIIIPILLAASTAMLLQPFTQHLFDSFARRVKRPPQVVVDTQQKRTSLSSGFSRIVRSTVKFVKRDRLNSVATKEEDVTETKKKQ